MKNLVVCLILGGIVSGCASDRISERPFGTVNTMFRVQNDPIVSAKKIDRKRVGKASNEIEERIANSAGADIDRGTLTYALDLYYVNMAKARSAEISRIDAPGGNDLLYKQTLSAYRRAGWNASRALCDYSLQVLGQSQEDVRIGVRATEAGSGFVGTMMALGNANQQSLSVFTATNALLSAWIKDV